MSLPEMLYGLTHVATNSRFAPGDEIVYEKSYTDHPHRGTVLGRMSNDHPRNTGPVDESDRTIHWYQVVEHGRDDGWVDWVHDRSILQKLSVLELIAEAAQ